MIVSQYESLGTLRCLITQGQRQGQPGADSADRVVRGASSCCRITPRGVGLRGVSHKTQVMACAADARLAVSRAAALLRFGVKRNGRLSHDYWSTRSRKTRPKMATVVEVTRDDQLETRLGRQPRGSDSLCLACILPLASVLAVWCAPRQP